jgi:hypothetical protein
MHPEIARELTAQRGRELRERAQQAMVAKTVSRRLRAMRRGADPAGRGRRFRLPGHPRLSGRLVPDLLAGRDQAAGQPGRVPAARRAA